jgi:signal transduction histidine kinase
MARIKVRARAVDMLGRQQIAGIPTAIHELFKNAHDAYAHLVRVDYIHSLDLLLLRDDGLGMTLADFESKWLTLGTESKVFENDPGLAVWTGPESLPRRTSLGEKGIGRLAIAAIGPQVLVYSRSVRPAGRHRPILGFVNWSLFEQPGLDLDRIDVPVIELPEATSPTKAHVEQLVGAARLNLSALADIISSDQVTRIQSELDRFPFDPSRLYQQLGPSALDERDYGTHFIVRPTSSELGLDLTLNHLLSGADLGATPLERYLLGFGNTMRGGASAPPITAEFWDHRPDGSAEDLIGPLSFFTPVEFNSADHHIEGNFDESGVFHGKVRIYDTVEHDYIVAPPSDFRGRTDCGPFSLNFAYIQGASKDTRMPLDEWKRLTDKCDRIGGLYIYRDGIRILPYGNSDYDWLNIERRRTLAAKDWFFSYRRLFGAVEITHRANGALVEKAGREGFRQNKAYRQFSGLIEELFRRLAVDFFRESARLSSDFAQIRAAKQREYELLQKRAKQVATLRRNFDGAMERFFTDTRAGTVARRCEELLDQFCRQLDSLEMSADPIAAGERLLNVEAELSRAVRALEVSVTVARPRAFGLNKRQKQDWEAYSVERRRMIEELIGPLAANVESRIRSMMASGRASVDPRRRLDEPISQESEEALSAAGEARKTATASLGDFERQVRLTISRSWTELANRVEMVKADLARTEIATLSPEEIERRRDRLIAEIRETGDRSVRLMQGLNEQLSGITAGLGEGLLAVDVTSALESENDDLRNQLDQYAELAQAGMALGLVQHEFTGQVRNINRGLDALKPWADRNKGLENLYTRLRVSFEHLESYLQLFIPLNRRLQRRRVEIHGTEVEEFLRTIFEPRLERHQITMVATPEFRRHTITTFPSTLMPAFVNVVDNAIHWLGTLREGERIITLDASPTGFLISNTGPGIEERDAVRIFEFGETTKPGGRGMGLYLSREALRREGMDILLERVGRNSHPSFKIIRMADAPEDKEIA